MKKSRHCLAGLAALLVLLFLSCLTPGAKFGTLGFEPPWKSPSRHSMASGYKLPPLVPNRHRVVVVEIEKAPPRAPAGLIQKSMQVYDYDKKGELMTRSGVGILEYPPKSAFGRFKEFAKDRRNQLRTERGEVVPNWP